MTTKPQIPVAEKPKTNPPQKPKTKNAKPVKEPVKPKQLAATVELPLLNSISGYSANRVDVMLTTAKQCDTLKRFWMALEANGAKLEDGTIVNTAQHAIRWLLEQAAANVV